MTSKLPETTQPSTIRTFLIADIRGWTRFTRELGDEAASRLASKFAQIVGEGVEAWSGRLLELRGDEAMCTFESARRALHCAVELQEAFTDESALAPELPLNVGIGLDAGEAVPVGDGYRGTALNVAARLCATAAAGEVIATGSLAHLAGRVDGLTFADLEAKPMKGFDQPVPAVLVDSATPHEHDDPIEHSASAGTTPPLPPELDPVVPLIARDAELRWLSWHWRRARHGHGGVVGLTGVAGIGCTRLVAELAAMGHREGAVVAYLRGEESPVPPDDASLVIIDDLERLPPRRARPLFRGLATGLDRRLLVAVEHVRDRGADAPAVESLIPSDRVHRLGPIDVDGVVQISRLYLDEPGTDVPAQLLLEESDGIPAEVHRVASQWARAAASRKLGESARRTSRERRELRAAEAAMIDDVERLETARERSRLFVPLANPAIDEPSPAPQQVCPYKGLAAFDAADADYFFGRERLIAELVARMVGSSFIGLVGASGSGKSSTLQAGLLPSLVGGVIPGSDEWIQVPMRPGEHPMAELEASLTRHLADRPTVAADPASMIDAALADMRPAQRLLVIVDQFEELFQVRDAEERAAFVDVLTTPRAGMKVLVSLRADHYERCAAYPRLARLIGAEQVLVGPLTADELRSVIRHPAERAGLRVDAELVDALVADVSGEPGGLPLLSTALLELWETRDGGRMTLAAYRATGGVRVAVARLAEGVYGRLAAQQQAVARTIFLRLAGEGDGGAIVRRRVRIEELDVADRPETAETLAALTTGRLVTATDGFVEVAHEALLREWPRLRGWIEEDSAGRQLRLHLMESARIWEEGGREEGDLYRGARLASVLDWSADHAVELNAVEREFVETSQEASERESERQRRTNRRLRGLLAAAAAMLIVAVGAGAVAIVQADRADAARTEAEEQAGLARDAEGVAREEERRARGRELHASAITAVERDPELAILLIREAIALGVPPPDEAVTALHQAVQASRTVTNVTLPTPAVPPATIGVALSPDGSLLYTSMDSSSVEVRDVESGELLEVLGTPREETRPQLLAIAVSPDGRTLAYVDDDAVLHLWDTASGTERTIQAPGVGTDWPTFDQDGGRIATITWENVERSTGKIVTVFDVSTGDLIREWRLGGVYVVGFHEDGRHLLATDCVCDPTDAFVRLDIESDDDEGEPFENVQGIVGTGPQAAQFSPDGRLMATAGRDGKINLWSTDDGSLQDTFIGHTQGVTFLAFSRDGTRLASTSTDGSTRIWDTDNGEELHMLAGQGGRPGSAAFSADAELIVTGSSNLTARVWSLSPAFSSEGWAVDLGPEFENLRATDVRDGLIGVYGRPCLAGCYVGPVAIFDPEAGRFIARLDDLHQGGAILLLKDGAGIVFQPGEPPPTDELPGPNDMKVYDSVSGRASTTLEPICDALAGVRDCVDPLLQVQNMALSPDGTRVAASGASLGCDVGTGAECEEVPLFCWFGVWTLDDGKLLYARTAAGDGCGPLAYSPEGTMLATGGGDRISVMDASTFDILQEIPVGRAQGEFSPDGSLLAVASEFTRLRLYDTESWEYEELDTTSFGAAFTSDGSRLITGDLDRFMRLWDLETRRELQRVPGGETFDSWRGPLDDDTMLMSTGSWLQVITFDVDALLEEGISRLSRDLTDEECEQYLHGPCPAAVARDE